MADVQKEKGHTEVANELLEAIIRYPFTGSELRIILFVIRKTYGFHKKEDRLPISQFINNCELAHSTVTDCLRELVRCSVLVKNKVDGHSTEYGIQKDYERWLVRCSGLSEIDCPTSPKATVKVVRCSGHSKETKETKERDFKILDDLREELKTKRIIQ